MYYCNGSNWHVLYLDDSISEFFERNLEQNVFL